MTFVDYLCLSALLGLLVITFWFRSRSLAYRYRDVIVGSWKEADFYLGNPNGSEFEYERGNSSTTWSKIVKRDQWICYKCRRKVHPEELCYGSFWFFGWKRFRKPFKRIVHVDHKVAFILGGKGDTEADGLCACAQCNIRRSAKIDEVCLKRVRELGKKIYTGRNVSPYVSTRKKRYRTI